MYLEIKPEILTFVALIVFRTCGPSTFQLKVSLWDLKRAQLEEDGVKLWKRTGTCTSAVQLCSWSTTQSDAHNLLSETGIYFRKCCSRWLKEPRIITILRPSLEALIASCARRVTACCFQLNYPLSRAI